MPTTAKRHPAAVLLDTAGPTVSIEEAASVLGISRNGAYLAAKAGQLPARVLRFGRRMRVSTADLRRAVGLDEAS